MRKIIPLNLIIIFVFFFQSDFIYTKNAISDDSLELEAILEKCAEYSERLESASLFLVCKEKISETVCVGPWRGTRRAWTLLPDRVKKKILFGEPSWENSKLLVKNDFVYDYQLIKEKENTDIEEMRVLIEENGSPKNKKNAKLETRFAHKYIVLGPATLLSRIMQPLHDYKIIEGQDAQQENLIVLEAIPKAESDTTYLYGKIWVDKEDFCIRKILWDQGSIEGFDTLSNLAKGLDCTPSFHLEAEFGFEKNGIRFPSSYKLEEAYLDKNGVKLIKSKKTVEYYDYKFFTVEVEVRHN